MIEKNETVTVAELISMLADGRITSNIPVATFSERETACIRGVVAFELYTMKDGSKALVLHSGAVVGATRNIESVAEVFP